MKQEKEKSHPFEGAFVLVRCRLAGLHYGILHQYGEFVWLKNSRRIWSWKGCLSCSELSQSGPTEAVVGCHVPDMTIPIDDVGEVHMMDTKAISCLDKFDDSEVSED